MKTRYSQSTLLATTLLHSLTTAQQPTCTPTLTASYASPSVAAGYTAHLIAQNLTSPRGIKFDTQGALLVVEEGRGISALNLVDGGNDCVSVGSRKLVIEESGLNHGIEVGEGGRVVFGSSGDVLWSWEYDSSAQANTSAPKALVTGMGGSDHTSRTLKLSKWAPGLMVVNRGSFENVDPAAASMSSGHSQVKAFNISNVTSEAYDFNTDGIMLGWGLRNDVGIDEEPTTGRIYTVENSADEIERSGQDIHQNNPAEELNFLGYLNGTESSNQGRNFGYPECFTAWQPDDIPDFNGQVGEQFAVPLNSTNNDTACDLANRQAPRLAFQAHTAPLDILFNEGGTAAWISFHGSWNRDSPIGYDLRVVEFENGEPVAANTSRDAAVPIMSNQDLSACPDGCFRPVGLAWDSKGRLFMSSDSTGEIYMIVRTDGNATSSVGSNATGTIPGVTANSTRTGSGAATSSSAAAAGMVGASALAGVFAIFAFLL